MELNKAIKELKNICVFKEEIEALNVVLSELENKYNKGYQDGFKQAKFDYEMDKLDGR